MRFPPVPTLLAVVALASAVACGEPRTILGEASDGRCAGCHLSASTFASAGAASASPPADAHAAHLRAGTLAGPMGCAECHPVPQEIAAPGHQDGRVDVVFSARAGGASSSWSRIDTTCAVACHGDARPDWRRVDGSQARCGSCHGIPPAGAHPAVTGGLASCSGCHPATVRPDGTIDVAGGAHVNGRADVLSVEASCGACHGIPPAPPHAASTSCGSCHQGYTSTTVNATLHQNGRIDVSAQACGSCHAIPPATGEHRKHVSEGISCGRCHEGASSTTAGPGHLNGVVNVTAPGWNAGTKSCANSCHGSERWD